MKKSRAPLIAAIVLLLLPVLYVGSYFALVAPSGVLIPVTGPIGESGFLVRHYRWGGEFAEQVYWPLKQIDRKLRPGAWYPNPLGLGSR
jgi:hypothetical protein